LSIHEARGCHQNSANPSAGGSLPKQQSRNEDRQWDYKLGKIQAAKVHESAQNRDDWKQEEEADASLSLGARGNQSHGKRRKDMVDTMCGHAQTLQKWLSSHGFSVMRVCGVWEE
jgi:hypothetical protein